MEVLVRANLLAVGFNGEIKALEELPVCFVSVDRAAEAVRLIRNERYESVLSKWQLEDMRNGLFLKRLRIVKPDIAIIVFVRGDDPAEEIFARSIGVSAVLTEGCSDELLVQTVAQVLGLEVPEKTKADVLVSESRNYQKNNY